MATSASNISSADASAIIDSALADASIADASGGTPSGSSNPTLLPTTEYVDQSEAGDKARTAEQVKAFQEEEKIRIAQEDMLGKEQADALRKEQEEQAKREATLLGAAEKMLNRSKSAAQTANIKIASIPTPGNLVVPLVLLLLFFFILIQYNGQTRLQWLWLVLTNNAYVTANATTEAAATPDTSGSSGNGGPSPSSPVIPIVAPMPSYRGSGMGSPFV